MKQRSVSRCRQVPFGAAYAVSKLMTWNRARLFLMACVLGNFRYLSVARCSRYYPRTSCQGDAALSARPSSLVSSRVLNPFQSHPTRIAGLSHSRETSLYLHPSTRAAFPPLCNPDQRRELSRGPSLEPSHRPRNLRARWYSDQPSAAWMRIRVLAFFRCMEWRISDIIDNCFKTFRSFQFVSGEKQTSDRKKINHFFAFTSHLKFIVEVDFEILMLWPRRKTK